MKEQYKDLRNKTVLDFCSDENEMWYVQVFDIGTSSREEYVKRMLAHPDENANAMASFASYFKNSELEEQVYKQFDGLVSRPMLED